MSELAETVIITVLSLSVGVGIGFSWLLLRIIKRFYPEGAIAEAMKMPPGVERKGAMIAFILTLPVIYYIFAQDILVSPASDVPGSKETILPMLAGPTLWLLVVLVFGEAAPTQRSSVNTEALNETSEAQEFSEGGSSDRSKIVSVAADEHTDPNGNFVIDGNNISHLGDGGLDVNIVGALARYLLSRGNTIRIYFDAGIGWDIADLQRHVTPSEISHLIDVPADLITIAPGGTEADEWILGYASEEDAAIISNDKFRDRESKYPFIAEEGRLIKAVREGKKIRVQGFKEAIVFH